MDYENFVTEFMSELKEHMPEYVDIERRQIIRTNEILDAIGINYKASELSPVVYLKDKYASYLDGMAVSDIAVQTAEHLKNIRAKELPRPTLTREQVKENLYLVLVNYEKNVNMLKNVPYERLGDLAVVPRIKVFDKEESRGSMLADYNTCAYIGMMPDEVMAAAHENTNHQDVIIRPLDNLVSDLLNEAGIDNDSMNDLIYDRDRLYIMTNPSTLDGAVYITSPDAMDKAYKTVGSDFYILPSSRHEVIMISKFNSMGLDTLKEMVKEANEFAVNTQDFLSNNVYEYSGRTKKITVAGDNIAKEKTHGR
jgi:hypothetical protein